MKPQWRDLHEGMNRGAAAAGAEDPGGGSAVLHACTCRLYNKPFLKFQWYCYLYHKFNDLPFTGH